MRTISSFKEMKPVVLVWLPVFLYLTALPLLGQWATLPKGEMLVAGHAITVEVARSAKEQSQGLMFRQHLPNDEGMLFSYRTPRKLSFWMRNTSIPLSIAYIDEKLIIQQIENMKPFDETAIVSHDECQYALEMNQGWFQKNKVQTGDKVDISRLIEAGYIK